MGNVAAAVVLVIGGAIFVLFALAWSTGAPATPTGTISGGITANAAQTLQITFTTQAESTAPPNSIWQLPPSFVYTLTENNGVGGTTVVAQQQHVAAAVSGGSWPLYTLTATVSVTTVAACSGCASNITVDVYAQTWGGGLVSPTAHIVFSSNPAFQSIPAQGAPITLSYWGQFLGAMVAGIGIIVVAVAAGTGRVHPHVLGPGIGMAVIGALVLIVVR